MKAPSWQLFVLASMSLHAADATQTPSIVAHTWKGPFRLPLFGHPGVAARTDYLVRGPSEALVFLTASKANRKEGRVLCVRTLDGGKSWEQVGLIGDEPQGYAIMPATVSLGEQRLLSTLRCRLGDASWIDADESSDSGKTWRHLSRPAPGRDRKTPSVFGRGRGQRQANKLTREPRFVWACGCVLSSIDPNLRREIYAHGFGNLKPGRSHGWPSGGQRQWTETRSRTARPA